MRQRESIRIRQEQLEKYIEKHNGRMTYERTKTRMNISLAHRYVLAQIIGTLQMYAPRQTGYGANHGIKLKRHIANETTGRVSKYIYDIIIGSEKDARSHQLRDAPYIAWQNFPHWPDARNVKIKEGGPWETWVQNAIKSLSVEFAKDKIYVQLEGPHVIANYKTGGHAGYLIKVSFLINEIYESKKRR